MAKSLKRERQRLVGVTIFVKDDIYAYTSYTQWLAHTYIDDRLRVIFRWRCGEDDGLEKKTTQGG